MIGLNAKKYVFSKGIDDFFTGINDAYRFSVTNASDDGTTGRRISLRAGNKALKPEEAKTTTFGFVIEPPALKGFSIGFDVWQIRQTDAITRLDAADIIAQDTALLLAANRAQVGGPIGNVNLTTAGSPNLIRNAVTAADTAAFAAYNATRPRDQQRAAIGSVQSISESYLNAARRNLAGFDFLVGYRTPKTSLGTLRATVEAAYLRQFEEQLAANGPFTDYGWRDGNTRWKGTAGLQWKRDDWTATWVSDYTGRTQDSFLRTTVAASPDISANGFLIVKDSWLSKASIAREFTGKNWLGGTTVRVGVNNVFNAEPPFGLGAASDTDGYLRGFGDPRGRAYYLEVSRKF